MKRDKATLNPPAKRVAEEATDAPPSKRVAKKARKYDPKLTAAYIGWRVRIMNYLKTYLDEHKCWQLLDEIKVGTPPSKISSHNISMALRKANSVYAYCDLYNRTYDPKSYMYGWTAADCSDMAGSMNGGMTGRTVRNYWEEYELSLGRRSMAVEFDPDTNDGKGTFMMDQRGKYERDWLLTEEDYLLQFEAQISNNLAKMSVDYMTTWVNETLLVDLPVEVSDGYGVHRPIRRKTVHEWMRRAGAKNEMYVKSYYNDKHEDPFVLVDRQVSTVVLKS